MTFTLAIIGRPNVGKSTLFNRLVGKRLAIVDDTPGVTRDRREGEGSISDLKFRLLDTAGLEDATDTSIEGRMRIQTENAVAEADVVLLLIDGRAGVTPTDSHFAQWLRTQKTPVLLGVNKCEGKQAESGLYEAYSLGLGEPIAISAEHGLGVDALYDALLPFHEKALAEIAEQAKLDQEVPLVDSGEEEDDETVLASPLQLAIVGRPNAGKSTLVNKLLGEDRMLTGPEAGITRDAIATTWSYQGRDIKLVDTAGLRKQARVQEKLEYLAVNDTYRAIQYAQVVVLVLDADQPLERQDLNIARKVVDEGRALIIAVNKWDTVKDKAAAMAQINARLQTSLQQIRGVRVVTMSALTGRGVDKLLPTVFEVFDLWNTRVPTGALNRWLSRMLEAHPPPMGSHGKRLTVRYVTQAKSRPPTFYLFSSTAVKLPESYLRYLANGLRDDFGLDGIPLRIHTRSGKNPYA
ncbi:MAG: ribosome biogenesis GTPase Der [Nitrospinae bacterium CG11_big_fil_rev_8_21_14_0_20_56_8]|nr:MAG: ribosome biogenesis GTPase Der [Nitrospinae bacterium CG11_big_fil_rev_8_21_14_0_20_56_8]